MNHEHEELVSDGSEETQPSVPTGEPLVLDGRIVAPPVKITGDDAKTIFQGFFLEGTSTTMASASVAELAAASSVFLVVKSTDDESRQKLRAAALSMEVGITAIMESEEKGHTTIRYEVSRGQLKRLLLKISQP